MVFSEDCFCKPCGLLKTQSFRAGVVIVKKEKRGAKLQGSGETEYPLLCLFYFFCITFEREKGREKNLLDNHYFLLLFYVLFYRPLSISIYSHLKHLSPLGTMLPWILFIT